MAPVPAPEPQNPNPLTSFATTSSGATGFDVGRLQSLDNDTASLLLEFIVRQRTVSDHVVNAVFLALPLTDPISPRLKKAILFRRLASDLALRSVSEKTLEIIELIEELDRENRSLPPSQVMKSAYCAVASSCTAAALRRNVEDFFDSFYRIWVLRISDIEKSAAASLISEELREVRDIFWEAVKDPKIRDLVVNIDVEETLDLVRDYLEQTWNTEPLFPVVIVNRFTEDLRDSGERRDNRGLSDAEEEQALKSSDCNLQRIVRDALLNPGNKATGLLVENLEETCNEQFKGHDGLDRRVDLFSNSKRGSGDTSTDGKETDVYKEQALRSSCPRIVQNTVPDTANKTVESLAKIPEEACNEELRGNGSQHRRDELASVFEVHADATSIEGKETGNELNKYPKLSCLQKMEGKHNASVEKVPYIPPDEENYSTQNNHNSDFLPRTSLMERNPTAHTFKWTDSPPQEGRFQLRSPRREAVSPLKLIDDKIYAKRRKMKKWTLLEEQTLIKAVRENGKGSWKFILRNNPTIFEERTEVDLKDKWRNMTK